MNSENQYESQSTNDLVELGSEIIAGGVGGVIGLSFAGPPGAIIGSMGAPIVQHTLNKLAGMFLHRHLEERERERIGVMYAYAIAKIQKNLEKGKKIRMDGFFTKGRRNRSDADEIYEGILLSAQRTHEEKKLQFLGNLMGNIAFNQSMKKSDINSLINLANQLTYQQFCLLNLFNNKIEYKLLNVAKNLIDVDDSEVTLFSDIWDLHQKGLLYGDSSLYRTSHISPDHLKISKSGLLLYELMELNSIVKEEIEEIAGILS